MSLELGAQLAGYRIDGVVGRGGMGVVYRATEQGLERPVALKLIAPELAGDALFRARFLRESQLAASIDHPGILPVYAAGEADGELYLATRFVDGTDLRALLAAEGALAPERALALVGQVAYALDAAHRQGLVHRDVKPGNVLVDADDHCYLSDFGLTVQLGAGATTAAGQLAGSLDYLAPEQIRGDELDARTDEYALACVLYECLAGVPPFRRESEAQTLWAHLHEDPAPIRELPALDPVLSRGLAKDPPQRYASCGDFFEDARTALGLGPSPVRARRRRLQVGRRLALIGAALVAAAVAALVLVLSHGSGETIVVVPNSVAAIDPGSREVVAVIPVGAGPTLVAASKDWVWVLNADDGAGTISRIDAGSRRVVSTFSVGGTPVDLIAAAGSLWVGTLEGRVVRIDASSDVEEDSWTLPNAGKPDLYGELLSPALVGYGRNTVWVSSGGAISQIDPTTSKLASRRSLFGGPLDYGFGSLWMFGREGLVRLAPRTLRRQAAVALSFGPRDVTVGQGSVWLPDNRGRKVWQIDPQRNAVQETYDVGGRTFAVAVGAGAAWASSDDGSVVRIDPRTGETERIDVGGAPTGVAFGAGLVWTSVD